MDTVRPNATHSFHSATSVKESDITGPRPMQIGPEDSAPPKETHEAWSNRTARIHAALANLMGEVEAVDEEKENRMARKTAQAFFDFALDDFAGGENRLELQASHRFQCVKALRGEEPAGGDFDRAVDAL